LHRSVLQEVVGIVLGGQVGYREGDADAGVNMLVGGVGGGRGEGLRLVAKGLGEDYFLLAGRILDLKLAGCQILLQLRGQLGRVRALALEVQLRRQSGGEFLVGWDC
jgi:hypothetical protein